MNFEFSLVKVITKALENAENDSDLVITTHDASIPAQKIAESVKSEYGNILDREEILSIASLINHAISDKKFFDWEMPSITGQTKEEFEAIAIKLRQAVGI